MLLRLERTRSEVNVDDDSSAEEDLVVPENAKVWKKPVASLSMSTVERIRRKLPPKYEDDRNLCYCNYSPDGCGGFDNGTCMKFAEAACFYFAKKVTVYDNDVGDYVIEEKYGCAPLTEGSGGSYFTCYAHLVAHHVPMFINCCYEGSYCNANLTFPTLLLKDQRDKVKMQLKNATSLASDGYTEKSPMFAGMSSGSGSGVACLNEKTIAHCLEMIDTIGCGRYGEVKKARYKGDQIVAVKSFFTKDEESWKNERDIYQTQMINHENILQFVAADISSEDSITRLLLITDYLELGSLHEYLQRDRFLSILEALKLAESAACGLEHLHSKLRGTGAPVKPAIAHRDIKSKNVLVKRTGVCCIADFGLAVSEDDVNADKQIKIQVGTKRYMAPEILNKTLNPKCFYDFKMADVYSFSLVIWEILWHLQELKASDGGSSGDSGYGSSGSGNKAVATSRLVAGSRLSQPSCSSQDNASNSSRPKAIQPYDDKFPSDPSLEDMRKLVCEEKKRPSFNELMKNDNVLKDVCLKVEECWAENINNRPTIMGVKMKLTKAILKYEMNGSDSGTSDYGTMSSSSDSLRNERYLVR
ncbi:unnamed protein product [Enterobius vermicularis]|uniref:receptor protein serine/threonine kinase n=1 Tax=Enterobius vermicularis TaxID=51028 RepID=A0A158Q9P8_ENTVE|nr:unnamed protein product [Enterobius vermicularis]